MQHLEVSGAVRPLKWSLGVKWLRFIPKIFLVSHRPVTQNFRMLRKVSLEFTIVSLVIMAAHYHNL